MKSSLRFTAAQWACKPFPLILAQRVRTAMRPLLHETTDGAVRLARGITGSNVSVPIDDIHGCSFAVHGYYDWRNTAIAGALLARGDTVVEIGANIGTETVGLSDIAGGQGHVFAFEPFPGNINYLERIRLQVRNRNIEIMPFALSDECATIRFEPPPRYMSGSGRLERTHSAVGKDEVSGEPLLEVECRTLDSFTDTLGAVRMLFVDTEGEEVRVLRGARNLIAACKPYIVIEASARNLQRAGFTLPELHSELCGFGYAAYEINRTGLSAAEPHNSKGVRNWLCVPSGCERQLKRVSHSLLLSALLPAIPGIHPLKRFGSR